MQKEKKKSHNKCIGAHLSNLRYSRKICWPIRTRVKQPRACHCTIHPLIKVNSVGAAYVSLCCSILWHLLIFTIAAKKEISKKKKPKEPKKNNPKQQQQKILLCGMNLCCFLQCFYVHLSFILILAVLRFSLSAGQPFHMYSAAFGTFSKNNNKNRDTEMECFPQLKKTWWHLKETGMNDRKNYKQFNDIQLRIIKTPINIHHKVQKTLKPPRGPGPRWGLRSELKMVEEKWGGGTKAIH